MSHRVLIGIQARSGSQRLPRKAFSMIAGKTMLERVVAACASAAKYITDFNGADPIVAVLTPEGDDIAKEFRGKFEIFEGPNQDVLARYALAAEYYNPLNIVRITGDCPMIPAWVISRITALALQHGYDYVANVHEDFRTTIDGSDCEVFSRRMLTHCAGTHDDPYDREHVTTGMRKHPPEWAKMGHVANHFDLSSVKLSVDTPADLERVREAMTSGLEKLAAAQQHFGKKAVHLL